MVEILLATYNGGLYLEEQLNSLLDQTYSDIRILVRDDGSTDRTAEIVKHYEQSHSGKVVLLRDGTGCGGPAQNFLRLVSHATAPYIMFADQDDYWFPEKVEKTLQKMKELEQGQGGETPVLVFSDYRPVDEHLEELEFHRENSQIAAFHLELNRLLVQNYVTGCTIMANRSLYKKLGQYDPAMEMHDWWAALYASAAGILYHLPEELMLYRQHGNNCVGAVDVKSFRYRIHKFLDKRTKLSQQRYLAQAECFYRRYAEELGEEENRILKDFMEIWSGKHGKLGRMYRLLKGRYLKSDVVRVLGQLWYV